MNTELIAQTWHALGQSDAEFIEAFYRRFFERFPGYRKLFPHQLRPAHLDKMIHTMALMANLSEDQTIIAPHLHKLGAAHKPFDLELRDMNNFKGVFSSRCSASSSGHAGRPPLRRPGAAPSTRC